jgi:hypothetical protein
MFFTFSKNCVLMLLTKIQYIFFININFLKAISVVICFSGNRGLEEINTNIDTLSNKMVFVVL